MSVLPANPHAFVTGGTGFVGMNLIERLLADGWRVTALHRPGANLKYLSRLTVTPVVADLTDAAAVERVMPEAPEAVFHVAGDLNMWSRRNEAQTANNVGGTRNVLAAAEKRGARCFIHTSTISAYGHHDTPVSESTPSNAPTSWINYERTKWLAEEEVRAAVRRGLRAVIINPCAILGPYDTRGWAQIFFMIRAGKVKGMPPGTATFNHVRGVAAAHVAAVERGVSGENYLLGGETAPFAELVRLMAERLGVTVSARVTPAAVLKLLGRVSSAVAAITGKPPEMSAEMAALMCARVLCGSDKAERVLGYRPEPLVQGIDDSFRWLRQERLI
jgi:nucleoside-diphosphate-sugar epimerase